MRYIMNRKGIDSLESLRQQALENGVEFIACQMSMDVMGVKQEELLDEVTIGGVATYMERADNANINLFSVVLQKYLDFISPLKYPCAGGWDDYTIKVTIKKGESNLVNKDGGEKTLTVNCNNGNIDIDL